MDEYSLESDDFGTEKFHRIIFSTVYNLYQQGNKVIDFFTIDSYLSNYTEQYKIFNQNDGAEYITKAIEICEPDNFNYNLMRMKKFSLMRFYESKGLDTKFLYNPDEINPKKYEEQQKQFDEYTIEQIIEIIEYTYVILPKDKFCIGQERNGGLAANGLRELKEQWKQAPEIGIPMQGAIVNTIARGARLKKLYLRSGATGTGKTRFMVADICSYSVPWIYDLEKKEWVYTGFSEPSLFISTELELSEIRSLVLAYISGVEEEHITEGTYVGDEEERVDHAIKILESAPLYLEEVSDFNIEDIENLIKKYKKEFGVLYVCFDYIHTSVKLIMEIATISKGMKLREDQILYIFAIRLKNICNKLGIHVDTSTQLNGEYKSARDKDETLLRGSKAIADKIDMGIIMCQPSREELKAVEEILRHRFGKVPNMIYHFYKVRKGKLSKVKLWVYAELGICRFTELFLTNYNNELIQVEKLTIENMNAIVEEHSVDKDEIEDLESESTIFSLEPKGKYTF